MTIYIHFAGYKMLDIVLYPEPHPTLCSLQALHPHSALSQEDCS